MRRFRSGPSVRFHGSGGSVDVWVAISFGARLAGLAGAATIPASAGLLIPRCAWVHTWGMRFPLDVAFLAWPPVPAGCAVLGLAPAVEPRRSVRLARPAARTAVLEAQAGALARIGLQPGASAQVEGFRGRSGPIAA